MLVTVALLEHESEAYFAPEWSRDFSKQFATVRRIENDCNDGLQRIDFVAVVVFAVVHKATVVACKPDDQADRNVVDHRIHNNHSVKEHGKQSD